jgi:hypothetical protein
MYSDLTEVFISKPGIQIFERNDAYSGNKSCSQISNIERRVLDASHREDRGKIKSSGPNISSDIEEFNEGVASKLNSEIVDKRNRIISNFRQLIRNKNKPKLDLELLNNCFKDGFKIPKSVIHTKNNTEEKSQMKRKRPLSLDNKDMSSQGIFDLLIFDKDGLSSE